MTKQGRVKAIIIGDSYTQRVDVHQDETVEWSLSQNTYTIQDLRHVKPEGKYDVALILLGTNNIKSGNDGQRRRQNP